MTELTETEKEAIACAIRHYLLSKYLLITDVYKVIDNRVQISTDPVIYSYQCPCQTIYLDEENYAVTCGRQYVETTYYDEDGQAYYELEDYDHMTSVVYYDFRDEISYTSSDFEGDTNIIGALTKLGNYEWKRSSSGGGGVI